MAEIGSYKGDILQIFKGNLPWEELSGTNILVTGATGLIEWLFGRGINDESTSGLPGLCLRS